MSETIPLSGPLLRALYAIEVEPATAARIDAALLTSSRRVLELAAKAPASMDGFEEGKRS